MLSRRSLLCSSLAACSAAALEASPLRRFSAAPESNFQSVKQLLRTAVDGGRATSIALAVVLSGQILWEEGFGYADRERRLASSPHTPYCLASITKVFTATLIASLAERGHLSLEGPAMPHLRSSPLQGPNGDPDAVTVRMLGAHCSGLPATFVAQLLADAEPVPSTSAYLQDYGRLAYPAGQVYEYGNIGYEALGAIAATVTGHAFGPLMDERILQPLGLHDSFFSGAAHRPQSVAAGYDADGKRIPPYRTSTPPSGELYASAHDLARFMSLHLRRSGMEPVLSDSGVRAMQAPVFRGPGGISSTFGWFSGRLANGEPFFFKRGGQPGVAAMLLFLPSLELGCAVLTNRTDGMPLVNECCGQIVRTYVPAFQVPEEDAGPGRAPFVASRDTVGRWRGKLRNGGADQLVQLDVKPDGTAGFALSNQPPEPVVDLWGQLLGFEGTTTGLIDCRHAAAFGTRTLALKLVPHRGQLFGRVTASGTRPGLLLANIPYVLTLDRA